MSPPLASATYHHHDQTNGEYEQTDAQIWKKAGKSLMNIGVPVTPVLIRRAKGVVLYVGPPEGH